MLNTPGKGKLIYAGLLAAVAWLLVVQPALAKDGADGRERSELYGLIEARPENGLQGQWIIGGQTFDTGPGTQFDEREGALQVGRCAKVQVRDGRVHEIEGQPMSDCP